MPVTDIILFGSYARSDCKENSDIDILILANGTERRLRETYFGRIAEILSDINLEYDVFMSIILDSTEEYSKAKNHAPLFKNVEKDGILLWTNQLQSVI
ncbi:MAG: nucleotidyltransferase domain-containing protein [Oscillospiraceae bacterium]|nr:nucleotidyltransferase domain-containing protein [Oscillospiraceae bacterium]